MVVYGSVVVVYRSMTLVFGVPICRIFAWVIYEVYYFIVLMLRYFNVSNIKIEVLTVDEW